MTPAPDLARHGLLIAATGTGLVAANHQTTSTVATPTDTRSTT
ncbi:hypothetical protein ACWDCB_23420 [Streptomyces sp. NPDC001178]